MGTKLVQGECRTKQKPWFLFFMPSRSLTWAKPKCARRVEYKANRKAFAFIPEPQPNLGKAKVCKASAGQNKRQSICFCFHRIRATRMAAAPLRQGSSAKR